MNYLLNRGVLIKASRLLKAGNLHDRKTLYRREGATSNQRDYPINLPNYNSLDRSHYAPELFPDYVSETKQCIRSPHFSEYLRDLFTAVARLFQLGTLMHLISLLSSWRQRRDQPAYTTGTNRPPSPTNSYLRAKPSGSSESLRVQSVSDEVRQYCPSTSPKKREAIVFIPYLS